MFNVWKKFLLVAALAVAAVGSAQAATIGTATLNPAPGTTQEVVAYGGGYNGQSINDDFRFTMGSNPGGYSGTGHATNISLQLSPGFNLNIANLQFSLFEQVGTFGGGDDISLGSGLTSFSRVLEAGKTYYALITGLVSGTLGGTYAFSVAASPVPLPAAVWLLAAGLAGLVGIARRKRPDSASANN